MSLLLGLIGLIGLIGLTGLIGLIGVYVGRTYIQHLGGLKIPIVYRPHRHNGCSAPTMAESRWDFYASYQKGNNLATQWL